MPTCRLTIHLEQLRGHHIENSPRGDRHHLAWNLEAEFNEADIIPKTRDTAIMATTAYIAANAPNNDEHM
jgi:hypothetical protein